METGLGKGKEPEKVGRDKREIGCYIIQIAAPQLV